MFQVVEKIQRQADNFPHLPQILHQKALLRNCRTRLLGSLKGAFTHTGRTVPGLFRVVCSRRPLELLSPVLPISRIVDDVAPAVVRVADAVVVVVVVVVAGAGGGGVAGGGVAGVVFAVTHSGESPELPLPEEWVL